MHASKYCRSALLVALGLLATSPAARAQAQSLARTQSELTWLLDSGELLPRRVAGGVAGPETPPWEGLAGRQSGRGNLMRLALSTHGPGFLPQITTSAALRVELDLTGAGQGGATTLRDASSSLAVSWWASRTRVLTFRAFPFDSDYLRLGYLHALDWAGSDVARRESVFVSQAGSVKAATISWQAQRLRLFLGLKWAAVRDVLAGDKRLWGAFGGGSFDLARPLRVDAGFGYFQRASRVGTDPAAFVEGASVRAVWHRGPNEPELTTEPFRPPSLREEPARLEAAAVPGYAIALEAVTLVTRQRHFDAPSQNTLSAAPGLALYGSLRQGGFALHGALTWRSLAFVIRDDPRLTANESLPPRSLSLAELSGWLGASQAMAWRLTAGVELGARLPAALQTPSQSSGYPQTLVVGGPAGFEALPLGSGRLPSVAGRLSLRWAASATLAVSLLADYSRNPNRTAVSAAPAGVTRGFADPDSLALLGAVQARF